MDIINGSTTPLRFISILREYGCDDVTHALDLTKVSDYPVAPGPYSDTYMGALLGGAKVAIKRSRWSAMNQKERTENMQRAAKEVYALSKLEHPNVLGVYGMAVFRDQISTVMLWMKNGALPVYLSRSPEANRFQLSVEISKGLEYLHAHDIVYGDLKGPNILIDEAGVPKLSSFGNIVLGRSPSWLSENIQPLLSTRWASPEILKGESTLTKGSDMYALGMVFAEVVTGRPPFDDIQNERQLILAIAEKIVVPQRPEELKKLGEREANTLWDMMAQCWSLEPAKRPKASEVVLKLELALPGRPRGGMVVSRRTLGSEIISYLVAQGVNDVTHELDLGNCDASPIAGGGFGDIYQGQLVGARKVAIKCPRLFFRQDELSNEASKNIAREVYTWSKLRHPNVLELIGLTTFQGQLSIVSPWLENGTLPGFLEKHPRADRFQLCLQIASGLAYLHAADTVHGDVKGLNILISKEGVAKLTDFGNTILKKYTIQFTGKTDSSLSVRWSAPELFQGGSPTKAVDIYALGMTFFEIITGDVPFCHLKLERAVMYKIAGGGTPERPKELDMMEESKSGVLWGATSECWKLEPTNRPSAAEVERKLSTLDKNQALMQYT